ncbi:MAG: SDR family oxidoreductase [Rubrobacteraceae bacterium]|nr:SDR family oxidoreductase [Rubrobacteraceae bacterium]
MKNPEIGNKVALVTGGAVGIGRGIALALAESGAHVALTWHSHAEEGKALMDKINNIGQRAIGFSLDVTVSKEVNEAVEYVIAELGRIDILVNNAGGLLGRERIATMSDKHWQQVLDVNLTSAFYCCRAVAGKISEGGRIINVSSLAAQNGGGDGATAYAAAKAGMLGLTRGLAKELAHRRVTVNAVAPGLILGTPFHDTFTTPESQQAIIESLPLGRAGYPADVASAVTWLCSEGASWVTGEVISINGGQYFSC